MPAQTLTYAVGDAEVAISDTGWVERVDHARRPGRNYVRPHRGLPVMTVDDRPVDWEPAGVVTDEGEIEARYTAATHSGLECTVRNAFARSWIQRQMLANTSSAPIEIAELTTGVCPADDMFAHAGVSAVDAYWIIHPADGQGPLLTVRLSHGAIHGHAPDGLRTGAIHLDPGRRFVLQWVIDFEPSGLSLAGHLADQGTARTELWHDEFYPVADADTAVLAPDPVVDDHEDGVQMLGSHRPGRVTVELRSARGSRHLDLAWVPRLDALLVQLSPGWLGGDRSVSGAPVLPDSGAALGLQHGLGAHVIQLPDAADEALMQHTARLLDQHPLSGPEMAFLAQETMRTGEPEPLDHAHAELLGRTSPSPGLGLAATRVSLAELASGSTPTAILEHLDMMCRRYPAPSGPDQGSAQTLAPITPLELNAVATATGLPGANTPAGDQANQTALSALLRLAAPLGYGLPVRIVHDPRPDIAAPVVGGYLAAVLDLMPESLGPALEQHCGQTPHELAEQARATALADVLWPPAGQPRDERRIHDLIGWIVLGRPAAGDA